jgi:hypothetical protein
MELWEGNIPFARMLYWQKMLKRYVDKYGFEAPS